MSHTIVTLKKGEGRSLKLGGPWIYDNEIAAISGDAADGDLVQVKAGRILGGHGAACGQEQAQQQPQGGAAPGQGFHFRYTSLVMDLCARPGKSVRLWSRHPSGGRGIRVWAGYSRFQR